MRNGLSVAGLVVTMAGATGVAAAPIGRTEITRWPLGRRGAVSITYDDGTLNQFRVAVPIMDRFGFAATFFIITGDIPGSRFRGTFVGRPTEAIVRETASVPTSRDNFFERASAVGFLGYRGGVDYHTRAGAVFDEGGDPREAYRIIDEAYAKVRRGELEAGPGGEAPTGNGKGVTWDELSALAKRGYEIASHTVTHPRLAVLDDANLVYELEKSRQEIVDHLGLDHAFSVECPYGTENERAVRYALDRYPLARNLMPDPFVEDLDRGSDKDPVASTREYVRWQRGVLTRTPMAVMNSWIDEAAARDNIWLVLVFHGVDGVGWEPRTGSDLDEYFDYLKAREDDLWVATFRDVAKYMRERMSGRVESHVEGDRVSLVLRVALTEASYDLPLTLRTRVPPDWSTVDVRQGGRTQHVQAVSADGESFVLYEAVPNGEDVTLERHPSP
jgi:peptidoglycan/xylan/chitin deacetylase (PgdA/CDA1 family)